MNHINAPGKSHILGNSIGFIVIGVFIALGVVYLLINGMIFYGIFSLIDVGFWLTTGILGIIHRENLRRAKLLRGLGIAAIAFPILAALLNGIRIFHFIMISAVIWFLVGAQKNVSALNAISKSEVEVAPLVQSGFFALENGEREAAERFFEQALGINPQSARAYIGKLCVELHLNREADLLNCDKEIDLYWNYRMAVQSADETHDESYKATLERYALTTAERQEKDARLLFDLANKINKARVDKDFTECRSLMVELKELPDSEDVARLRLDLGTVVINTEEASREFDCPLCHTQQTRGRTVCSMCGVAFVRL